MAETSSSQIRVDRAACPSPHSAANKAGRLLWQTAWLLLFRPVPWFWQAPRRAVLRLFGARIGRGAQIMPSVRIWAPWNLALGAHATVSQRAFLCTATHDIDHPHMPLKTAPIRIGAGAWVCAEAYVHPGVSVGVDAVVGVRAVALHDVLPRQVVGGNPARSIRERRVVHDG